MQRFTYSCLGDDVNLASRLEGQCKTYSVGIIIGDKTRLQVPDYATLELDLVMVKGKTEPERVHALFGGVADGRRRRPITSWCGGRRSSWRNTGSAASPRRWS